MKQDNHNLFLGIFVLSGFGLLGTGVTLLGAKALWEDYQVMETYIKESVSGLESGSPVKFRGITVGKVESITTVSKVYDTQYSYALVRVKVEVDALSIPAGNSVDETFAQRVRRGLRVYLSRGLTGATFLETEFVDNTEKYPEIAIDWVPNELYVPSSPSTLLRFTHSLDAVLDNLAKTDMRGVVAAARDTLREFEKSMGDLDFDGLSKKAQTLMDSASRTIDSAGTDVDQLTKDVTTTLTAMRETFGTTFKTADVTLTKVNSLIDRTDLRGSLEKLAVLIGNADDAVTSIRHLTNRADHTVASIGQIVRGRSRDLQVAIGNLREVLDNINSLTGTLEQYPSLLFVGNAPKGSAVNGKARAGK